MSKAERKEREREMRRNEIVDAAEKLFFARGYENVTMDDIAKELEMARATLYLSFKNKEDIYAAIAIRASKFVREMFQGLNQGGMTGLEKVRFVGLSYYEFYKRHTGYYLAYYHTGMFDQDSTPELAELKKMRVGSMVMFVDAVKEGMKDGSIRDDIDPDETALIILNTGNSALNLSTVTRLYMETYGLTQEKLYKHTIDMMIRSIENIKNTKNGQDSGRSKGRK